MLAVSSVILPNNANISSSAFENTGEINVGGIYYGGKGTVNIGNYTFDNVGFIKLKELVLSPPKRSKYIISTT